MGARVKVEENKKYGYLTAIKFSRIDEKGHQLWVCRCDCGREKEVRGSYLVSGHTKTCGKCNIYPKNYKHGMSRSRLYNIYHKMISRCYNRKDICFEYYGYRGIKVCDEWRNSFEMFKNWSLANGYSDELTIDRINVNGDYEPTNCRWATMKDQQNNRRNNKLITYNGVTHTISEWSDITGIGYDRLEARITVLHWDIEKALTEK